MSEHTALIEWNLGDADFAANKYSRVHTWTFDGGAMVEGSASPHIVPVPYSSPEAVDPEEAYVASLSSCHMLWFLDLARRAGFEVKSYTDQAIGKMVTNEGKVWISVVELHPKVDWAGDAPDQTKLKELHHASHEACFIANSVKTDVQTILD